jgi:hypothetical protein
VQPGIQVSAVAMDAEPKQGEPQPTAQAARKETA